MSLAAYIWAGSLRLDECDGTAFRVLLKYADRADEYGRTAWYKASELAEELGCHRSTIQRAIAELLASGLISKGDQRFVQHIPANYRPVVYDLETPAKRMQDRLSDVASANTCDEQVSQPCDTGVASGATYKNRNEPSYQDSFSHPPLVTARESTMNGEKDSSVDEPVSALSELDQIVGGHRAERFLTQRPDPVEIILIGSSRVLPDQNPEQDRDRNQRGDQGRPHDHQLAHVANLSGAPA